jgi:hypothetical protein
MVSRSRRSVSWAILSVALAVVIFVLSAQPNLRFVADVGWDFVVRKAGHMAVFGLLAGSIWRTGAELTAIRSSALVALVITILSAVSDEVHQGFTAGRNP